MSAHAPRGAVSEPARAEPRDLWQRVTARERARIVRHAGQVAVQTVEPELREKRAGWLARFAAQQRSERRWILCDDLADWCARREGRISRDHDQYVDAARQLILSLFDGQFAAGRHHPFLLTGAGLSRLSPEAVRSLVEWWPVVWSRGTLGPSGDHLRFQLAWAISPGDGWSLDIAEELRWLVAHIWVPREAARLWLESKKVRYPAWLGDIPMPAAPVVTRKDNTSAGSAAPDAAQPKQAANRKRRHAGYGYDTDDEPLLTEMARLLDSGAARSSWAAAQRVVGRAKGVGSDDAKTKRLVAKLTSLRSTQN